jgi:hypothetical protein
MYNIIPEIIISQGKRATQMSKTKQMHDKNREKDRLQPYVATSLHKGKKDILVDKELVSCGCTKLLQNNTGASQYPGHRLNQ